MRLRNLFCSTLILSLSAAGLSAQTTLYSENFNGCALPTGWQVSATGNQNPTWSVGISQNNDAPGQSIDGTCFLFIDDESEGNGTAGYVLSFTSPAFNASQYPKVELTMDIHYRDWDGGNDYLEILLTDGTTEKLISRFDRYRKNGSNIADHFSFKADLALLSNSANTRLIIRYSDGGGAWAWWAGVDNIKVTGSGTGANVVKETFNGCAKPAGWTTQLVTGTNDWKFGLVQAGSDALQGGNSMDGTCFAYFDDDALAGTAPAAKVRLISPWFDGTLFGKFELNYDVILRYYKERIRVIVQHQSGTEFLVNESNDDLGGPYFPNFIHQTFDISFYRAQQMRVVFEFDDNADWGWWAGIDNVKVTGFGVANDLCANAVQLTTSAACMPGDNLSANLEGPTAACASPIVAGVWYRWQANFTGTAKLTTHAEFNDVVNVFTGTCAAPQVVFCNNRDEHGFTGETNYFPVQSGTQYLIRVSGQDGGFGMPRGEFCIEIAQGNVPTLPSNDNCPNALPLTVNGNCTIGNNADATMSAILPTLNVLARADLWYTFTAATLTAGEKLEIQSNASFSDVITLYTGGCNAPQEVVSNHKGGVLELPPLTNGQNYWVQIAGNFATIEGSLCPQLIKKQANAPSNDDCLAAIAIPVGGQCTAGSDVNASPSPYTPSCVVSVERDVWFSFVAPVSGSVHLNSGADFQHSLAVWQGGCNNLTQVFCAPNPLRCNGFVTVNGLESGQTYYVQIASSGSTTGDVCLKILNGLNPPDFVPLVLEVTENCISQTAAELLVTASGGVPPYTFTGNINSDTLSSGDIYLSIVTDAIGCEQSITRTVNDCNIGGCALTATVESTSPKCASATTGVITATPSGGIAPYQYKWSNDATSASVTGLVAGTYSLTITDAAGCETTLSQTLTAPPPIVIAPAVVQLKCNGDTNGSISTSTSGGVSPYQYKWSNNATTAIIGNLPAGTYTLTVTDANLCESTATQTLANPPLLQSVPVFIQPKCFGDANGSIAANATGGMPPYQYLWSNNATTANINNLLAGTYLLTVTDANGCSKSVSQTLSNPPALQITLGSFIQPTAGQSNGAINVHVAGGAGGYGYSWSRNGMPFAVSQDLTNIPAGLYVLQLTDSSGCMTTFTYNLTETVGTHNPDEAFYAVVFPNPATEQSVLAVSFAQPQSLQLSLSDVAGRILQSWAVDQVTEQHIPLDLKDLPDGVYWLQILAGNDVVGRRVVVGK